MVINVKANRNLTVLMADDDADDRLLAKRAFATVKPQNVDLIFVENGEELMDHLHKLLSASPIQLPHLILLDLNMPRKNGWEVLDELKASEVLKKIPVIILTTSATEEDILTSYKKGVSSFITKPVSFERLTKVIKSLLDYWFEVVELPKDI